MSLPPGTRLGSYEVIGLLGAGGMGEVYSARDTRLGREVAIKVLPADVAADAERLARFEREARAVSALNHPNIVTLYEVGTSDTGPYLVLERVDGESLRAVIASGPMPVRRLLGLGAQIAAGLAKAHAAGVVHRDLKPDNIMVTADGFAKILDFGLARLFLPDDALADKADETTLARQTASGVVLGTLGYLSPEQAAGKPADYRADQFALGALLYEMATGLRPFKRETVLESLTATMRDEPEPLRSKRADLPSPLAWLIERCLSKSAEDRYASTKDLARDLADLRDRLSEIAEKTSGVFSESSPRKRRPTSFLALGAAVVVGIAGFLAGRESADDANEPPSYRPITFRRGLINGARFSADGKTVYYSASYGGDQSRVFMARIDGAESKMLDLPPGILLSVSSKNELAMLQTEGRNAGTAIGTLVLVPAVGGTPRPLLDDVVYADFAPDGERLLAVRKNGSVEFPIGHPLPVQAFWARVSPSGDRIAIIGNNLLQITDLQGKVLFEHREPFMYGFAWGAGDHELWFTGSQTAGGTDRALYALTLDGRSRLVARAPGAMTVHDVAPDGGSALVSTAPGWISIGAVRAGEPRERLLDLQGRTQIAGLSADGKWVLLTEEREVGTGAYLRSTDGKETYQLGARWWAIGLKPDGGSALVCDRKTPTIAQLIPRGAGAAQDVPLPPDQECRSSLRARWSADGRRLIVGLSDKAKGPRLWMREGAEWRVLSAESLTRTYPSLPAITPDGRTVAWKDITGAVWMVPIDGGTPTRLEGETGVPLQFSANGRELFLFQAESLPWKVYRRDIATGRVTPWRSLMPDDPAGVFLFTTLFLSDDEQSYVYQFMRASNELWLAQGWR
jgi:serine/threonine protein kinase